MPDIKAYAALKPGAELEPFHYAPDALADDEVEIEVAACGLCHSDLAMIECECRLSQLPLAPGSDV